MALARVTQPTGNLTAVNNRQICADNARAAFSAAGTSITTGDRTGYVVKARSRHGEDHTHSAIAASSA
jgi:hypothetical protein